VQLFIMPGGNSAQTMAQVADLSDGSVETMKKERRKFAEARKVPQAAFRSGMNYIGTCAGFFTAASGYDIKGTLHTGWGLWPGLVKNIGPGARRPMPDVDFDPADSEHPLFKVTQDGTLREMYYNGGPIGAQSDVPDTEYFGKYRGGALTELADDWFCVAYRPKDNLLSGRLVITTGHPESRHVDFLMAMAVYALDHDYEVPRRTIEPAKPVEAVSGDDQMQYYCLTVEAGRRLTVTLTGLGENCDLYIRAGLPPTLKRSDAKATRNGKDDESITIADTKASEYFIGVHGRHSVLNGANYTLTATIE
jgi:hypothetical protein